MNIITLIKQVPDLSQLAAVADALALIEDGPKVLNPWDEYALETALQLKETHGGAVTALTLGPPGAGEALRTAIAMGVDEAALISDPALANSDSLTTARALAAAIRKVGSFDLIVAGRTAVDGGTAATAIQVAALLDIPAVSYVAALKTVDPASGAFTAVRLLDSSRQVVNSRMPALITVVKEINEPRYPTFMGLRKAKKADIPTWTLADLGLAVPQPALSWQVSLPPARAARLELIEGSPAEAAQTLAGKLLAAQLIQSGGRAQ